MSHPPFATDDDVREYVERIVRLADAWEFHSFTIGTRLTIELADDESRAVRRDLNIRVAMAAAEQLPPDRLGPRDPTHENADIVFLVSYPGRWVEVVPTPLFVYGRYLKFSRDLPQARWLCVRCRGKGMKFGHPCGACGGLGKMFPNSVEEVIGAPLLDVFRGEDTKFHATGRQDIDVRMLGRGRPFAIELVRPRRRTADLPALEHRINSSQESVAVRELQIAGRALVRKVDTFRADKSYRAIVLCRRTLNSTEIDGLKSLAGTTIGQQTPQRVAHRRADKVRMRSIRSASARIVEGDGAQTRFELDLLTQSGTYIKEFITGDDGRTRPSLSEILCAECICEQLDVLEVHFDPIAEDRGEGGLTAEDAEEQKKEERRREEKMN